MRAPLAGVLLFASLTACGDGDLARAGSVFVKSALIRADTGGGIVVTAADDASLAGTRIDIPAGALDQDTTIGIADGLSPVIMAGGQGAGPVVNFQPDSVVLRQPAAIVIPCTGRHAVRVHVREPGGGTSLLEPEALAVDGNLVSFAVSGLAEFQAAAVTCAVDLDCPAGHGCSQGLCDPLPEETACDGADNDRDGYVDEGCGCTIETGCAAGLDCVAGICVEACTDPADCPVGICGNGTVELGEQCDDGNTVDDDGCTNACTVSVTCGDEICGDGLDGDCDGYVDDGCPCVVPTDCAPGLSCVANVCAA